MKAAGNELMDARPTTYDLSESHPLNAEAERALRGLPWVRDVHVRLREEGHVFAGEARVVPVSDENLTERLDDAADRLVSLDWRLHDVVVAPATADGLRDLGAG